MSRSPTAAARERQFPLGAAATPDELDRDPHPVLARLRAHEPVSWLPALAAWLVTRRDLALEVVRRPDAFTVDDPRFSTAQVVGASMLSLDGGEHARHRSPFARPFRLDAVRARFSSVVADETERLLDAIAPDGRAELRRSLAGPLAVAAMREALGLAEVDTATVLGWYDAIVAAVTDITAGRDPDPVATDAVRQLREAVADAVARRPSSLVAAAASDAGGLVAEEVAANAAVLLFGGIETTEGMITNALLHLLQHRDALAAVAAEPGLLRGAVEESLRLEPAAAVVDRYATADVVLGGAEIRRGELVRVSLAGANRDPVTFPDPDRFDVRRANAHLHLAFAQGPHVCLGMHLARLEAHEAVRRTLARLPGLRLDPDRPSAVRGLVFRKPQTLWVRWRP